MQTIEIPPELITITTAAISISKQAGLNYVGTESLLYAIVTSPDLQAYKALVKAGVNMPAIKAKAYSYMTLYNRKTEDLKPALPYTPAVEGIMALSGFERNEADSVGLISAILKAENTPAARVLYSFKITYPLFYQISKTL